MPFLAVWRLCCGRRRGWLGSTEGSPQQRAPETGRLTPVADRRNFDNMLTVGVCSRPTWRSLSETRFVRLCERRTYTCRRQSPTVRKPKPVRVFAAAIARLCQLGPAAPEGHSRRFSQLNNEPVVTSQPRRQRCSDGFASFHLELSAGLSAQQTHAWPSLRGATAAVPIRSIADRHGGQ